MLYTNDQVNLRKMQIVADRIINLLPKKRIVLLYGDLGAGKTQLVKIVGKKLGIKNNIFSPTFLITKHYNLPNNLPNDVSIYGSSVSENYSNLSSQSTRLQRGKLSNNNIYGSSVSENYTMMYHYDLYRLSSFRDLVEIGFTDVITDKNCIIFIEWPDKIKDFTKNLEKHVSKSDILKVYLEHTDDPKIRKIKY